MTGTFLAMLIASLEKSRDRRLQMDDATPEQAFDSALFAVITAVEEAQRFARRQTS